MTTTPAPIAEYRDVTPAAFRDEIVPRYEPALLRGLADSWPAVRAGRESARAACSYLAGFDRGAEVEAFIGPPEIGGRFFYAPDMRGFKFQRRKGRFGEVLRYIESLAGMERSPAVYVGAAAVPDCLPGFAEQNPLPLLAGRNAVPRVWIGNESVVSTHFDQSDNIAIVAAGRRRVTLFPPDQLSNLYIGPLDHNMAGQPASMVDLRDPDFETYPRFRKALEAARTVELEPGDGLYIPALWWHDIEALSSFNILVNFWWDDAPPGAAAPFEAMVHALLALGDLPPERRAAWRTMFDHYGFRAHGDPAAHLEPEHRGILGTPTPQLRDRIRQFLLRGLGRR
jgi:hypothetical protein